MKYLSTNVNRLTKSSIALAITSLLAACGGSDGEENKATVAVPNNCLLIQEQQTCFNTKKTAIKGSSFTIAPTSGNGLVRWSAPAATAIEHGNTTHFTYDSTLADSNTTIYAIHPTDETKKVAISVELTEPEQQLNIYPVQFALQTSSTELNLEWIPVTSKAGRMVDITTKIEVVEIDAQGNPEAPIIYDIASGSTTAVDVQPDSNYLVTLVVEGTNETYRSLPVPIETSHVEYREKDVITVPELPTEPPLEHEVGALILHNDILYVVVEDESHKKLYKKAHPFQLFDGQIPGFNTVVSDVDESTIRALSELATHNQEMMRIDPHIQPEVRFDGAKIAVNNLRFPSKTETINKASKESRCEYVGPIRACAVVDNKTNFLPQIKTEYDNGAYMVRAEVGVDASITNTFQVGSEQEVSAGFDPIGISRELDIAFPKIKGLNLINKLTAGQRITAGVTVGFRGEAGLTAPSAIFGMKNAVYAKMTAGAGAKFSDGLIPLPKPVFEKPKAAFNASIAQPLYENSYFSTQDTLKIRGQLDFGAYATIQLLEGFEVSLDAYERGTIGIGYTMPSPETLLGIENPVPFMVHTNAANMKANSAIDGRVKFDLLDIDEPMENDFGHVMLYELPKHTPISIAWKSQCLESGRYRPAPDVPPEHQNVYSPDNGWLVPGDTYGSEKRQSMVASFGSVMPQLAAYVNSTSATQLIFVDKINTNPVVSRAVYRVVKKSGFSAINAAFPMIVDLKIEHSEIKTQYPWVCWGKSFKESTDNYKASHTLNEIVFDLENLAGSND